ncbi:hypothetical protein SCG7086_BU_00080 [Chlamydiales bacterium SCGC AG-110-P3]|nr:hypothetical protein SCG7086_BU_00080 [Chlamydiales bacterium SCGC AG-110-P3]
MIKNQEEHHKSQTFEEEHLKFFNTYNVQYNKRYVFDELT